LHFRAPPRDDGHMDANPVEAEIRRQLDAADLDRAATAALRGYGAEILCYLGAILDATDAANDAFSHFCEKLWKSLASFRREASFRTFAYRLAWCAAQDQLRDPYRNRVRRLETSELSRIADEIRATTSLAASDVAERWTRLQESLDTVDRSLLALRIAKRLSWREVAEVMSEDGVAVDPAALRKRFERMKKRLHGLAEAEGLRRP
jgi:RNA polymerase sigma-70 factor (ECF subfamily)